MRPGDTSCQPFSSSGGIGASAAGGSVAQSVQTMINLSNTSVAQAGTPVSGGGGDSKKPASKEAGPAASDKSGAKNEKPVTKTYCN
jgi:hypothetical protein